MFKHILLIDDDAINNFIVQNTIIGAGIAAKTSSAENGQEGIDFLLKIANSNSEDVPEIILLDINMPVMNGWEFIDNFRSISEKFKSRIKIFMVSSSVYAEDIQKAKDYPEIVEFISKPLKKEVLLRIASR